MKFFLKKHWKNILLFTMLLCLFIQQYSVGCHAFEIEKILPLIGNIYKDGFLAFLDKFSWAVLVLFLFIIPNCTNTVERIIKLLGEHLVKYAGAANSRMDIKPEAQNQEDKNEFKKEKQAEVASSINLKESEKRQTYKERREIHIKLERLALKEIRSKNIENFTQESKIVVEHDPVANIDSLFFDCSYRYMGKQRARRYVNTIFVTGSLAMSLDRLYKYIRIMNDINAMKNNQRFIIEIIYLSIDDTISKTAFERISTLFQKAISDGILAIKEYGLQGDELCLKNSKGWILES